MIDVDLRLHVSDSERRFDLDVTFATDAHFLALYGPSGAGKTLTLQAIAGLLRPVSGHVRIGGKTLFDAKAGIDVPTRERGVGYLFQHYALFPYLSVRQNVAFGLTTWWRRQLTQRDAARVDELIGAFGLRDMVNSRPRHLSGGQQQRVALARALACSPRVLLLDEPFAALNPMLRESLRAELAKVARQYEVPTLMISHDVDDVLALADVALIYDAGRLSHRVDVAGLGRDAARSVIVDSHQKNEDAWR